MLKRVMLSMTILLGLTALTYAAVPQLINFQGALSDASGIPLDGFYGMTFKLYGQETGGTEFWAETHISVEVVNGLFSVKLGSIIPFAGISPTGNEFWMGITVDTDPEISPRTQWVSVPFAFLSASADTAQYARQAGSVDTASFAFTSRDSDTASYAGRALFADTADYADFTLRVDTADVAKSAVDNSIGSAQLIDNNVLSQDIKDSTIIGVDISKNTIMGTHLTLGAVNSAKIADGTILLEDFNDMGAGDGQIIKWSSAGTSWMVANDESGSGTGGGWTDDGTIVRLTTIDDSVGIGTTTPSAKLDVVGDAIIAGKATIGSGHTNSGAFAFVVGRNNSALGDYSVVSGGGGPLVESTNLALGHSSVVSGGYGNTASDILSTVGGGRGNVASNSHSTVGGGDHNTANGNTSTVGGGRLNFASGTLSTVGGGSNNRAIGLLSTVSGGTLNDASGPHSLVGGGRHNKGRGEFSVVSGGGGNPATDSNLALGVASAIPGGRRNIAAGDFSFAAGLRAQANHHGCFVWADSTDADFTSTGMNQFNVRATGGTRIFSNSALTTGVTLAAGGGSWATVSDSAVKENLRPVDGAEILEKLSQLDISRWNYITQDESIEHIGPMAQDFYRLFGLGEDDKHINTLDPDGVALAAIKALHKENQELKERLLKLEDIVKQLAD